MTPEQAEKGKELIEEIEALSKYEKFIDRNNNHSNVAHFELAQHFGRTTDYEIIVIDRRHTKRFLGLLETIISELKEELKNV